MLSADLPTSSRPLVSYSFALNYHFGRLDPVGVQLHQEGLPMNPPSLRAWLAVVLAGSALLFFVGIYLERNVTTSQAPPAIAPSTQPEATHAEGGSEEGGEAAPSEAPVASLGEAGETAEQHAAEARPFGLDLESPLLVGAAIAISLLLAVAVVRTTAPRVLVAILLFAALFALFDLLEVSYQLTASRPGLAVIAGLLVALLAIAALIAIVLLNRSRATTV